MIFYDDEDTLEVLNEIYSICRGKKAMRNLSCGSLDYFQESKSSCRWLQIFLL
jgi:hypothetical protein